MVELDSLSPEEVDQLIDTTIYLKTDQPHQISISSTRSEAEVSVMLQRLDDLQNSSSESTSNEKLQYSTPSHSVTPIQMPTVTETSPASQKSKK